ncbi:MAG TPA: tol-pal system protein YbgF [Acidobacteriota bacterium]|nr:tol-pal system protein YbgF [Acidobacteriota bacterium]
MKASDLDRRASGALRRPALAGALAALMAASAFGCAPSGYYRTSQTSLDSLLTSQAELLRRVNTLDRKVETTRESVQATRASTDSRLTDLTQRMDVMEGKIDASGERFKQMGVKIDTVKERLSRADSLRGSRGMGVDSTAILDPEAAYQAAYADLAAGRYDLARQAFTEYLRHYPETEVSDNAQYWIGECLYATGDFNGAVAAYALVVQRFPKGDKVAAALLKSGYALARLNRNDEAKGYFQQVVKKYPKSDEARLAKERLGS